MKTPTHATHWSHSLLSISVDDLLDADRDDDDLDELLEGLFGDDEMPDVDVGFDVDLASDSDIDAYIEEVMRTVRRR